MKSKTSAVLIAGPTASGKSALAQALAARVDGVVINADSMQVYRELRILTARPLPDEEAALPHRLYGTVSAREPYSVGRWLPAALAAVGEAWAHGKTPILVGGTGLYFAVFTEGLADVPPVPVTIRAAVRARMAAEGAPALHAELARRDPVVASRLRSSDPQRIARALEVLEATGRSLAAFQAASPVSPLAPEGFVRVVLAPPRAGLYVRIDARFEAMLGAGALEEAATFGALGLPADTPAGRALGLAPLLRHLAGKMSLEEAKAAAQTATRQYAKRQLTWFRNRMIAWNWISEKYSERNIEEILSLMTKVH